MKLMALILMFVMIGCSSSSSYKAKKGDDGYTDQIIDGNLRMVTFQGNSKTSKERAETFAKFRAIEICKEMNSPIAHILVVKNQSFQKEISQTSTYYPSYYYGAAPYYGRYGPYGAGVNMYYAPAGTTVSNETYEYPKFDVYFECVTNAVDSRVSFKPLSQSQVEKFSQDMKGGVEVDEVLPDSPNKNVVKSADIILKANGNRVGSIVELYKESRNVAGKNLKLDIIREGKPKVVEAKFVDVTEMASESQNAIIKEFCKLTEKEEKHQVCKK